jgi:HlyD family secretion protein
MKKLIISGIVGLLLVGALLWFWLSRPAAVSYKTAKIERGSIVSSISATGTVNAVSTVLVGSQVSGTILKLHADYNSRVQKGQPIAEIEPALFLAQVEQARGNWMHAQASLLRAKVTLTDATRTLERNRRLLAQGVVSQIDFDASQTAYESAQVGIKAAEASLTQTRGALHQAETNLKNATIRSPVDGIVISRNVDVGQTVAASFQTPTLFTIAQNLTKMQIETSVDESDISRAQLGQPVNFTVDAYPERTFSGTVTQIRSAPITVQNVVTYVVVVQVDNRELLLKPGMTANVSIETGRKEGALKLPAAALRFRPRDGADTEKRAAKPGMQQRKGGGAAPGPTVYLLKAGKPVATTIQTGMSDTGFVEVTDGPLTEGDEVIVEQLDKGKKKKANPTSSPMGPRF